MKFSVSVRVNYKKPLDVSVAGKLPGRKAIREYLTKKRYVSKLAKRIAGPGVTVSGAKLDDALNLSFRASYKSDRTAQSVRGDMKDSMGIEKCSGSAFPGPCFVPSKDGKQILGTVKVMSVKVTAMEAASPKRKSQPKKKSSPKRRGPGRPKGSKNKKRSAATPKRPRVPAYKKPKASSKRPRVPAYKKPKA